MRQAATAEGQCSSLYVGNLDPRVTDAILLDIFRASVTGGVVNVKIIPDKHMQHGGFNYGFVDFADRATAEAAMQCLNGRTIFDREIKVNWAYQGNNAGRQDISTHYHVFVGDLCPEITDATLHQTFCAFGSLSHARVIQDLVTRKSRGYGFLAFRERSDAEKAISTMNGTWLGSKAIRVNWATQKSTSHQYIDIPTLPVPSNAPLPYDFILNQCSPSNCTVYVGNLAPSVRDTEIMAYFQPFGYIVDLRHQPDRGYAFVKLDSHERAATAIYRLQGSIVHGRPIKVSWGKDKANAGPDGQNEFVYHPQNLAPVDPADLPPLSDPIAAAAAAAAQAAVVYQFQSKLATKSVISAPAIPSEHNPIASQAIAAMTAALMAAGSSESYSAEYYAYYYQYYLNQSNSRKLADQ